MDLRIRNLKIILRITDIDKNALEKLLNSLENQHA